VNSSLLTPSQRLELETILQTWLIKQEFVESFKVEEDVLAEQLWLYPSPMPADDDEAASGRMLNLLKKLEDNFSSIEFSSVMHFLGFEAKNIILEVYRGAWKIERPIPNKSSTISHSLTFKLQVSTENFVSTPDYSLPIAA
jgi:hypothetical protein